MNGEENTVTVFIIAASAIVRAGLEAVLKNDADIIITGNSAEMLPIQFDFSERQRVDVLLVNIEQEKDFTDLLELSSHNRFEENNFPAIVALFPTELLSAENVVQAVQADVRGILSQDAAANEIIAAVASAANNLVTLSPETAENLLFNFETFATTDSLINSNEPNLPVKTIESLTPRESEVLEMMAEGASNKSIAYRLNISEHTIKFHVASIFSKLGVNTRTEAVTQALRRGFILL